MFKRSFILIAVMGAFWSLLLLPARSVSAAVVPGCYNILTDNTEAATPEICPDSVKEAAKTKCILVAYIVGTLNAGKEVPCDSLTNVTKSIDTIKNPEKDGTFQCGKDDATGKGSVVMTSFDFGCLGKNYVGNQRLNPIVDMGFAIFRFLSAGVGLIVVGSIIVAGIQYSASRGDPQAITQSRSRIINSVIGLLISIFIFAIANFLVPGGMFIK